MLTNEAQNALILLALAPLAMPFALKVTPIIADLIVDALRALTVK